jgi:predicted NAD/FAD-dependent oxidoreductase
MHDVLIVGAGLAGLACARDLRRAGKGVLVLDKSRGVSGRAATRRMDDGRVDHGAQFFTARTDRLRRLVEDWQGEGWLRVWTHGFPVWQDGAVHERPDGHPRFAPLDGMNTLGRTLARDLDVVTEAQVTSLTRLPDGWRVLTGTGDAYEGRELLLNLPAPQILPLVEGLPLGEAGSDLARVRFDPTLTLVARPERDPDVTWRALEVRHDVLSWVSRDHTKRREGHPPVLVAHATGEWSARHLDTDRAEVESALLDALREVTGAEAFGAVFTHRWRFATPTVSFPRRSHHDARLKLGWCGDWCSGGRVEGALESGWDLAHSVLSAQPQSR